MTTKTSPASDQAPKGAQARELQARLYREIGISAVSAALRFTKQPDPNVTAPVRHPLPPGLRNDDLAA